MKPVHFVGLIVFAGALAVAPLVQAQYPTKSLRLIVPYPPGGGTDTLGRVFGQKLSEVLGQQVVLDNRPVVAPTSVRRSRRNHRPTATPC